MDLMVSDESPSQISDKIKEILYAKSAEKIETIRPEVAASIFDSDVDLDSEEDEVVDEFESDVDLDDSEEEEYEED